MPMPDIGILAELYHQGGEYFRQNWDLVIGYSALFVGAASLYWGNKAEREDLIESLERLKVHNVLGIPASQIPNLTESADIADYIFSGGKEEQVPFVQDAKTEAKINQYATRVKNGENGLDVLHEALKKERDISDLFTPESRV